MNLQQTLQLGNGFFRMHDLGGDALGTVDAAAAADGHDGFAAMLFVGLVAQLHIVGGGVGGGVGLVKIVKGKSDENPRDFAEGLAAIAIAGILFAATFAIEKIFTI